MSEGAPNRSALARRAAAALLLALMALQAIAGMRLLSTTYDETTHLPSGYAYWKTGDFRLNPQHPPLIKLLCAAPLLALGAEFDPDDPGLREGAVDEWGFGYRFLYTQDAERLLFWGRMPAVMLGLLLAFYVHLWATRLFGVAAGFFALTLCAFSPAILGHMRFVTFDVGLACFATICLYHLSRYLRSGARLQLAVCGLALGAALASKYSGLVVAASVAVLLAVAALRPGRRGRTGGPAGRRALRLLGELATVALPALLVIQAAYFFDTDPLVYWKGLARVHADHDPDHALSLIHI